MLVQLPCNTTPDSPRKRAQRTRVTLCSIFSTGHILRFMVGILFWVAIIVFSFVLELHSNAFIAVFIGFGAAVSFVLGLAGLPFAFQAGAWLAVSAVSLITLRPYAIRKFHHHRF